MDERQHGANACRCGHHQLHLSQWQVLRGEREPHQNAAAIITENMPHNSRSGVELKSVTLAMLDLMVSASRQELET